MESLEKYGSFSLMENKFLAKFLRSVNSIAGFFGIIIVCVCIAAAFAWPLWFWATNYSVSYTFCVLAVCAALACWQIVRIAKNSSPRRVAFVFLRILIAVTGIVVTARLILSGKRFVAIPVFIGFIVISIIVSSVGKSRGSVKN